MDCMAEDGERGRPQTEACLATAVVAEIYTMGLNSTPGVSIASSLRCASRSPAKNRLAWFASR